MASRVQHSTLMRMQMPAFIGKPLCKYVRQAVWETVRIRQIWRYGQHRGLISCITHSYIYNCINFGYIYIYGRN